MIEKEKENWVEVEIELDEELWEYLDKECEKLNCNRNEFINHILKTTLNIA